LSLIGTRETAFVHAISSAGVANAVTRSCSTGTIDRCGCDRSIQGRAKEGFEWSGCSDNIAYGNAFAKTFVDARERVKGSSTLASKALMNLHNNNAGRKVYFVGVYLYLVYLAPLVGFMGKLYTPTCLGQSLLSY